MGKLALILIQGNGDVCRSEDVVLVGVVDGLHAESATGLPVVVNISASLNDKAFASIDYIVARQLRPGLSGFALSSLLSVILSDNPVRGTLAVSFNL